MENYEHYGVARGRWSDTGSEWDRFHGVPAPPHRVTFSFHLLQLTIFAPPFGLLFTQSQPPKLPFFLKTYPLQGKFINFGVERSLLGVNSDLLFKNYFHPKIASLKLGKSPPKLMGRG